MSLSAPPEQWIGIERLRRRLKLDAPAAAALAISGWLRVRWGAHCRSAYGFTAEHMLEAWAREGYRLTDDDCALNVAGFSAADLRTLVEAAVVLRRGKKPGDP